VGYAPAAWATFGGALAAVAGALTGLLFVALSVKGTALSESPALSSRAAQTLVLFMTSVLIAVVLVAPQPSTAVGAELVRWRCSAVPHCSRWTGVPAMPASPA
jgi:hypothetical protein